MHSPSMGPASICKLTAGDAGTDHSSPDEPAPTFHDLYRLQSTLEIAHTFALVVRRLDKSGAPRNSKKEYVLNGRK